MKKIKYSIGIMIIINLMMLFTEVHAQSYLGRGWGSYSYSPRWNSASGYLSPVGGYSYSYGGYGYHRGLTGLIVDLAVGIPLTIAQASLYSGCRVNVPYYDPRIPAETYRTVHYREQRMVQVPVQVTKKFCRVIRYSDGSTAIDYSDCYYKTETSYEWVLQ